MDEAESRALIDRLIAFGTRSGSSIAIAGRRMTSFFGQPGRCCTRATPSRAPTSAATWAHHGGRAYPKLHTAAAKAAA